MTALDPITPPARLSQTLLAKADSCRRSAYLYLKYQGVGSAHELAFGSAAHAFAERLVSDLIAQGESSLYAPAEGEDPVAAAKQVASLSAAMVDEVLAEHPEWTVPIAHKSHSVDHLREVAYHLAVGLDVDPQSVLGLEQKFVLDLDCGWTVSGKIDLLAQLRPDVLGVDDYKSSFNVPAQAEFEEMFQLRLYAVLALFGCPVESVPCPEPHGLRWLDPAMLAEPGCTGDALCEVHLSHRACPTCEGKGTVERRLPPVGDGVQYVRGRQVYPRYLDEDNTVRTRDVLFTRQQLQDWRFDLERLAASLGERLGSTDPADWPAVPGSHCNECACAAECPLPAELRKHAGTVNTEDDAREALAAVLRSRAGADAMMREVRAWAKRHGRVVVGDFEFDWRDTEKWETDWPALEPAIYEAAMFGKPFELGEYRKRKTVQSFSKRKLAPEEIAAQIDEEANANGSDSRWGDAAPF